MKSIGFWGVCIGVGVLLGNTGIAQSSRAAISVTTAAAFSEVRSGEEVYVRVTFTNNLNRVVALEFASPLCDYTVEVRNSAGNLASDTDVKSKSDCSHPHATGADGFVQLKPNGSTTGTISVSMFSDLSRPGEYSVQVGWREPKELGGVELKSNRVKITVLP
jgi:hypothetical protein